MQRVVVNQMPRSLFALVQHISSRIHLITIVQVTPAMQLMTGTLGSSIRFNRSYRSIKTL